MSSEDEKTDPEIKGIKKINVARASGIMLAGTMVSRLLGFVRAALLIALIGSRLGLMMPSRPLIAFPILFIIC